MSLLNFIYVLLMSSVFLMPPCRKCLSLHPESILLQPPCWDHTREQNGCSIIPPKELIFRFLYLPPERLLQLDVFTRSYLVIMSLAVLKSKLLLFMSVHAIVSTYDFMIYPMYVYICVCGWICSCEWVKYPQRQQESIKYPGVGVWSGSKLPCGCWKWSIGPHVRVSRAINHWALSPAVNVCFYFNHLKIRKWLQ